MTCAKRHVVCYLYDRHGELIATGANRCKHPQDVCPREPGEGYAKCVLICRQVGHAEEIALANAAGYDLTGGTSYVTHYRVCAMCRDALEAAGIAEIECVEVAP